MTHNILSRISGSFAKKKVAHEKQMQDIRITCNKVYIFLLEWGKFAPEKDEKESIKEGLPQEKQA